MSKTAEFFLNRISKTFYGHFHRILALLIHSAVQVRALYSPREIFIMTLTKTVILLIQAMIKSKMKKWHTGRALWDKQWHLELSPLTSKVH